MRTVADVVNSLRPRDTQGKFIPSEFTPLPTPLYAPYQTSSAPVVNLGLAVKSMANHTTNEGWELFQGLEKTGYILQGYGLPYGSVDIPTILDYWGDYLADSGVSTVVMQDKREWEGRTAGPGFDSREKFTNVHALAGREDIFKLTVLKDSHQSPEYHRQAAAEIGCHAWVVYYHPDIVHYLAPWTRKQHLVRTYHTVDSGLVPTYSSDRPGNCVISGARHGGIYPLRERIWKSDIGGQLLDRHQHPGYNRIHCHTPAYLRMLSRYKVAICTSSIYGYALRKIIEATACGCRVVTDLPTDDVIPWIDGNLIRVSTNIPVEELRALLVKMCQDYDPTLQRTYTEIAVELYDYRAEGKRLAGEIEKLRRSYQ